MHLNVDLKKFGKNFIESQGGSFLKLRLLHYIIGWEVFSSTFKPSIGKPDLRPTMARRS